MPERLAVAEGVDQCLKFKAIRRRFIVAVQSRGEKFRQDGTSERLSVSFIERSFSHRVNKRTQLGLVTLNRTAQKLHHVR
jgi:hypothetical protein